MDEKLRRSTWAHLTRIALEAEVPLYVVSGAKTRLELIAAIEAGRSGTFGKGAK